MASSDTDDHSRDGHTGSTGTTWLVQTCAVVGTITVGLTVNAISDGYEGAVPPGVGGTVFLVLLVAVALRRTPAQAPIQRLVARTGLVGAGVAALVSLVAPPPWRPWVVLVTAALALIGCLAPTSAKNTCNQLMAVALAGAGVANVGAGLGFLLESNSLLGATSIGVGVASIGISVAAQLEYPHLLGTAAISGGTAFIALGAAGLLVSQPLLGGSSIGIGVATIGMGTAALLKSRPLLGTALIGLGAATVGAGLAFLLESNLPVGATLISLGVAAIGVGLAYVLKSRSLLGTAAIGAGSGLIGLGVLALPESELLLGAALISSGLAFIGLGVASLRSATGLMAWLRNLVSAPRLEPRTIGPKTAPERERDRGRRRVTTRSARPVAVRPQRRRR